MTTMARVNPSSCLCFFCGRKEEKLQYFLLHSQIIQISDLFLFFSPTVFKRYSLSPRLQLSSPNDQSTWMFDASGPQQNRPRLSIAPAWSTQHLTVTIRRKKKNEIRRAKHEGTYANFAKDVAT
jgi:hypothetical protein